MSSQAEQLVGEVARTLKNFNGLLVVTLADIHSFGTILQRRYVSSMPLHNREALSAYGAIRSTQSCEILRPFADLTLGSRHIVVMTGRSPDDIYRFFHG